MMRRLMISMASALFTAACAFCVRQSEGSQTASAKDSAPAMDAVKLAVRAGKVVTMDGNDRVVNNATVFIEDGRIVRIDGSLDAAVPEGFKIIDARDKWVVPGMVDAHNHTAASLRDLNDMVYLTNPGLRTLDSIMPENELIKDACAGGVTTVLLIPGSGTNMSGFGTLAKTAGKSVEEVVEASPGSLKIAQAGNPEWYWYGVGRSFMNWNTRQTLLKALDYHQGWHAYERGESTAKPEFDPIFEDFRGLFDHRYVVSVHTQMYQVLMTTVSMLARKLDLATVLDHCTFDAYKLAPLVIEQDVYAINGPRQFHFDRSQRKMMGNAARWWGGGVRKLGINTDAPVIPQNELPFQAAMACWYGWRPYPALRGVTRVPAEALLLGDKIGVVEPGKQADLGIWTGDPIDPRSVCVMTIVNGKIAYDSNTERRW